MLSSSTSYAGVTETPRVPVALSAPERASGQLSLNGLPSVSQFDDAYQPQLYVGNTNGGPCPPFDPLESDGGFYYGHSAMPIEGHPSAETLDAFHSQHFHGTGQPDDTKIVRSHSEQSFIFHGLSPFGTTTPGEYQQSFVYTVSQDLCPMPPTPPPPPLGIVVGLTLPSTAPIYFKGKKLAISRLIINYFSPSLHQLNKPLTHLTTSGTTRKQPSPPTIPRNKPFIPSSLQSPQHGRRTI